MSEKEKIIERLAFIQYLTSLALQKSEEPEPFCWVSILNFHDAIELFLELSAEKLGVPKGPKELKFSEYWVNMNPILMSKGKNDLTQKIQIGKLNEVRIALKHHGTPHQNRLLKRHEFMSQTFWKKIPRQYLIWISKIFH
jgi:hypothetical protein